MSTQNLYLILFIFFFNSFTKENIRYKKDTNRAICNSIKNISNFYVNNFLNADENIFNGINAQQCNSSQINEDGRCCYISIYTNDDFKKWLNTK